MKQKYKYMQTDGYTIEADTPLIRINEEGQFIEHNSIDTNNETIIMENNETDTMTKEKEEELYLQKKKDETIISQLREEIEKKSYSSTPIVKKSYYQSKVDDNGNEYNKEDMHNTDSDIVIIKRLLTTGKFRCPQCFRNIPTDDNTTKDILRHGSDTGHSGDFNIYKDPVTGKLYMLVKNELIPIDDMVKKEKEIQLNEKRRQQKVKIIEERIDELIKTEEHNNKINKIDKEINKVKEQEIKSIKRAKQVKEYYKKMDVLLGNTKYDKKSQKKHDNKILKEIKKEVIKEKVLRKIKPLIY